MVTNLLYSLKIWLTSVVIASLFYLIILNYASTEQPPASGYEEPDGFMYFLFVVFGLFFSFIIWFVFLLIIMLVSRFATNIKAAKCIICITGVVLTIAIFRATLFNNGFVSDGDNFISLMLANCFCIGFGSWIYKLTLLKPPETNTQLPQ